MRYYVFGTPDAWLDPPKHRYRTGAIRRWGLSPWDAWMSGKPGEYICYVYEGDELLAAIDCMPWARASPKGSFLLSLEGFIERAMNEDAEGTVTKGVGDSHLSQGADLDL